MNVMMSVRTGTMVKTGKVALINSLSLLTNTDTYLVPLDTPPAHDELDTAE
jgi:hypothetical protein